MKNKLISLSLLLALCFLAPVAAAAPTMYLIPDSTIAFRDSLFTLYLLADASTVNLKAYSVEINFDRNIISADSASVVEGALLATPGDPTFFWVGFSPDSATLYVDGAILGDGATVTGTGILATITFKTVGFGTSDINFISVRARDGDNNSLIFGNVDAWIKVCQFVGDVNADNRLNISDAVYLINWIFASGPYPIPDPGVGDVNCDSTTTISDVVYIINYIFASGAPPCGPCY
ncbi:MAG: dockerin type I domain-containing protein [Candidatus Zixiibacteriota bacterium]